MFKNIQKKEEIANLIDGGVPYIIPERRKEWIKLCRSAKKDIDISILKDSLQVIKLLEDTDLSNEEIKKEVDKGNHTGFSWTVVQAHVVRFCVKGYDFVKDDDFLKGEKWHEGIEKTYEKNLSFLSQLNKFVGEVMEKTKSAIIPERRKEWEEVCRSNATSEIGISLIKDIAITMNTLNEGKLSYDEIRNELDKGNHSGTGMAFIMANLVKFTEKGYEFYDKTMSMKGGTFSEQMDKFDKENKILISKKYNNKK